MDSSIIRLDSVDKYNRLFGLETLHPQVSVVDLSQASKFPTHFTINYGVYALYLKETVCGDIRYGKQTYDYQEGTITSFAPGQRGKAKGVRNTFPSRPHKGNSARKRNKEIFVFLLQVQ